MVDPIVYKEEIDNLFFMIEGGADIIHHHVIPQNTIVQTEAENERKKKPRYMYTDPESGWQGIKFLQNPVYRNRRYGNPHWNITSEFCWTRLRLCSLTGTVVY